MIQREAPKVSVARQCELLGGNCSQPSLIRGRRGL
jgi:hypothetical protein